MSKPVEKTLLFLSDFLTLNATFWLWARLRLRLGYFAEPLPEQFAIDALALFLFWLLLFFFYGLYRSWHAQSRVDEFINVAKTVSLGVFIIFLVTLDLQQDLQQPPKFSRALILSYWLLLIVFVSSGRLALRTFQRTLLEAGLGARNVLIVGGGGKAREIFDEIRKLPALGYNPVGFIAGQKFHGYKGSPWLGEMRALAEVITREEVQEVIIAVENDGREEVMEAVRQCAGLPVQLKLAPSLYDAIIGQVRTHQIYGLPLIEIMPENMPAWERRIKRVIDVGLAALAAIFLLPLAVIIACAIRKRPFLIAETKIGEAEKSFRMYRFHLGDAQALPEKSFLKFVARTGWDKMPRLLNVLRGDLSLIGPRPEAPEIAAARKREMPFYAKRWRVKPGLTGWAQIKAARNETPENSQRDLQHDFFYIENMSLRMDVKILLIALYDAMITRGAEHTPQSLFLPQAPSVK
jgi:lipopolysaccharide/colanic/teichoic acid biosynthesis glycosyltransferase